MDEDIAKEERRKKLCSFEDTNSDVCEVINSSNEFKCQSYHGNEMDSKVLLLIGEPNAVSMFFFKCVC